MTDKPNAYNITPEHFARARADIDRRRAQLDAELAQVDADAAAAAHIAERYPEDAASPPVSTMALPAPTTGRKAAIRQYEDFQRSVRDDTQRRASARPPNTGKPYSPEDLARIAAASHDELKQMAPDMGRPYEALQKQREVLLKQQREHGKTPKSGAKRARKAKKTITLPDGVPLQYPVTYPFQPPHDAREAEKEMTDTPAPDRALEERIEQPQFLHPLDPLVPPSAPLEVPELEEPINLLEQPAPPEQPGSENSPIVEPTDAPTTEPSADLGKDSAARELAEFDARRQRMPRAKPGIPVRGLTNDGPGYDRFLDPVAFASRRPE